MAQCDRVLATGGGPMVSAAYSSGTPALGVGVGNAVKLQLTTRPTLTRPRTKLSFQRH